MRMFAKGLGAIALVLVCWQVVPALASNLNRTSRTLGARDATIGRCDVDGAKTVFDLSGTAISGVTASGLAAACGGAAAKVTVVAGGTSRSATSTIPAGGGTVTFTFGSTMPMADAAQTEISLT